MIQVLLFHAWNVGSPIGLDAFLMISAFLMTASFIRSAERGKTPFFIERWANTFKRLVPPLIVVVALSLWASVRLLPANRVPEIFDQAFASLTYTQNWRLIDVAADYFAENSAMSSPFMHLWSMSVQGQVFLLWPVILALCAFIAKRFRWRIRPVAFVVFTLIAIGSLVFIRWGSFSIFVEGVEGFIGDKDLLLAAVGILFFSLGGGKAGVDGAISASRHHAREAKRS